MKNMSDMAVCCVGFWLTGWALAFGLNADGKSGAFAGEGGFLLIGEDRYADFMFQYAFAATAATIVSGAVVGRIRFKHYVLLAFVMTSAIYPIVAHAGWSTSGFLSQMGFVDFAGSCVVHVTGGAVGLFASLWLGPRPGVFRENGEYAPQRSSPTQALMGTICLWYSWFSFNAGSSQALTAGGAIVASRAAASTLMASGSGFLVSMVWSWARSKGQHIDVFDSATGLLAGLVAVTASCASVEPWEGLIIGGLGAVAALASVPLLERLRIDDAVAVIPVHLVAGAVGTLLVGFFANDPATKAGQPVPQGVAGLFHGGDGQLLGVQALALVFVLAWTGACFLILALVVERCLGGLRVPALDQSKLDEREIASGQQSHRQHSSTRVGPAANGQAVAGAGLRGRTAASASAKAAENKVAALPTEA